MSHRDRWKEYVGRMGLNVCVRVYTSEGERWRARRIENERDRDGEAREREREIIGERKGREVAGERRRRRWR